MQKQVLNSSSTKTCIDTNNVHVSFYSTTRDQSLPSCSSILSHSSKMKCLMCLVLSVLSLTRARILPGVPTTMCGQLFLRTSSSFLTLIPPKNTDILMLSKYLLNRSYSLYIWNASSLNNIQMQVDDNIQV